MNYKEHLQRPKIAFNPYMIPGFKDKSILVQLDQAMVTTGTKPNTIEKFLERTVEYSNRKLRKLGDFAGPEVTLADIKRKTRKRNIVRVRQLFWHGARKLYTGYTFEELGEMFGTDHSTVIHGNKTLQNIRDTDKDFNRAILTYLRHFGYYGEQ